VGAHGARAPETGGVVDGGLEAQSGDLADARHAYEATADGVILRGVADAPVELDEGVEQHLPCLQHRQQRVAEPRIGLDGVADRAIKGAAGEPDRQLHPEDLEDAADLVLQINAPGTVRANAPLGKGGCVGVRNGPQI